MLAGPATLRRNKNSAKERRVERGIQASHSSGFEMTVAAHKIRIYDLAKELKLDNKRVIDDARREGIDVSVPSNTVPMEVAERIRTKYYPKKIAPAAGPRLVKTVKSAQPEPEHVAAREESVEAQAPEEVEEAPVIHPAQAPPPSAAKPDVARPVVKLLKRTPPPPSATQPETPLAAAAPPAASTPIVEGPAVEEAEPAPQRPQPRPPMTQQPEQRPRSGVQVRVLRPQPGAPPPSALGSAAVARTAGPGVRAVGAAAAEPGVVTPAPKPPSRTTYIPEDTGRPRRRTRRGGKRPGPEFGPEEGKHVDVPRHLRSQVIPVQTKA